MFSLGKMGITEGGDAAIDFQWLQELRTDYDLDGCIVITKRLCPIMFKHLIRYKNRIILHVTVTGYAGSILEPFTPDMDTILDNLIELERRGFPNSHVVLRIDPIIPTERGLEKAKRVLDLFHNLTNRVRVSMIDMYPAVEARFFRAGIQNPYGNGRFIFTSEQEARINEATEAWVKEYPELSFECCAEPDTLTNLEHIGCVSARDYEILGLTPPANPKRKGQRPACPCLSTKTELLGNKFRCPNQCLYCYWHDQAQDKNADEILLLDQTT